MTLLLIGLAAVAAQAAPANKPAAEAAPPDIVVTGTRAPTRAPVGSRIDRAVEVDPRGFVSQVRTESHVMGMTPTSGMDPFAGATRRVEVKACKSSEPRLSKAALCDLAAIQRRIAAAEPDAAFAAIERFLERGDATPVDRFVARRYQYELAAGLGDTERREEALRGMTDTGELGGNDLSAARRSLAAMALARGDEATAIKELERVTGMEPTDGRSHANLAALYSRSGRMPEARSRMALAVASVRAQGQAVPQGWLDFLSEVR